MKRLLLLGLAILAVYMGGRAVRRNAEVMAALWILLGLTATASTAGTAKSRSTEDRLNSLIPAVFPNTGGTVTGSMTVTGNHAVGGSLTGGSGSGSTLTVASPTHVSGAAMTVDNGITSHANVAADGNVTAGGNISTSGSLSVGGSTSIGGLSVSSLSVTGGSTVEISPGMHIGGGLEVDGALTVTGGSTVEVSPGMHIGGSLVVDGNLNGHAIVVGGQGSVTPVSGGTPATYNTTWAGQVGSAVNGIINRLNSSGLS